SKLADRLRKLREELDSYYSVVDQYEVREGPRALPIIQGMRSQIVKMESEFADLLSELQLESGNAASLHHPLSVDRSQLGDVLQEDVALVEYFTMGNSISAFVMSKDDDISFFPNLTDTFKIDTISRKLQFQLDKVSYGEAAIEGLEDQLMRATLAYLGQLHKFLIEPLQTALKEKLVIIPHGSLHNLPFHAFHNGEDYLIDRHEITFAPSASVLRYCWDKETAPVSKPLAIGVGDQAIPQATEEAASVASLFPDSTLLVEGEATQEQLTNLVPDHDALHLASHATFSEDNPAFSRIKMEGGWLTLDDIYNLDLAKSALVTLSACETGVSSPNAGDELVGLTRGFFYAGTPSLVVSLWKVNDEVTTVLMQEFYQRLRDGKTKAAALREAMLAVKEDRPHPYFWAPFVLSGKSV
ncbi:MAG: CHAT domain-containing protein, partial [SAR202 cluster bacterium]|nr:CHAT domain-containing protein [SAR202 cluster bacterium]